VARSFANEMTIDPETGLPALPERFAWKVERYDDRLYVQLVKSRDKTLGFWAKLLGKTPEVEWNDHYIDGNHTNEQVYDKTKSGVLAASTVIYEKLRTASTKISVLDELVGLYPPKSIL
jgi:hypothetical protein